MLQRQRGQQVKGLLRALNRETRLQVDREVLVSLLETADSYLSLSLFSVSVYCSSVSCLLSLSLCLRMSVSCFPLSLSLASVSCLCLSLSVFVSFISISLFAFVYFCLYTYFVLSPAAACVSVWIVFLSAYLPLSLSYIFFCLSLCFVSLLYAAAFRVSPRTPDEEGSKNAAASSADRDRKCCCYA